MNDDRSIDRWIFFFDQVKQTVVEKKQNEIVNRLNKTKTEIPTEEFIVGEMILKKLMEINGEYIQRQREQRDNQEREEKKRLMREQKQRDKEEEKRRQEAAELKF